MLDRRNRHRMQSAAALTVVVAALAAVTAGATSAQPPPQPTGPAATPANPAPPPVQPAMPSPPAVVPTHGSPFVPIQGDWEGTAAGFTASFSLVLDAVHQQRPGVPQYGIEDLVMLRPSACPADPARYRESIVTGRLPAVLGDHGNLGLGRFGLDGALTGKRSAVLQSRYVLPSCHGTLTWHLHPAVRRTVANGNWTLRYSNGERSAFHVQAGGRLATAVRLPASIAGCNGLQGTLDVFIGTHGRAAVAQSGVRLALRFANAKGTGTLTAAGCHGGPLQISATHRAG
jgi:hypothetical protein